MLRSLVLLTTTSLLLLAWGGAAVRLDAVLNELGMRTVPDLAAVNTSAAELRRMTRKYRAAVRLDEREVMVFQPRGCRKLSHVTFTPDLSPSTTFLTSARLRFPDDESTHHIDVTTAVRQWMRSSSSQPLLRLPCGGRRGCCRTRLEVGVRPPPRAKRSSLSSSSRCRGECCRKSLKISFKEIGWDWVVLPKDFEAFYCKGRCRDVTSDFASTHALMRSILKEQGRNVSRPCCVPRRLKPLSLLHYNDKSPPELVVTRKKGMIVKECACT